MDVQPTIPYDLSGDLPKNEYKNLMYFFELQKQLQLLNRKMRISEHINELHRINLLAEFYGLSSEIIKELMVIDNSKRAESCKSNGINPYIFRTLFDYNRYSQCLSIYNQLVKKVNFSGLKILDFGCMVSDYGYFFGMLGSIITICDKYFSRNGHKKETQIQAPECFILLRENFNEINLGNTARLWINKKTIISY